MALWQRRKRYRESEHVRECGQEIRLPDERFERFTLRLAEPDDT